MREFGALQAIKTGDGYTCNPQISLMVSLSNHAQLSLQSIAS